MANEMPMSTIAALKLPNLALSPAIANLAGAINGGPVVPSLPRPLPPQPVPTPPTPLAPPTPVSPPTPLSPPPAPTVPGPAPDSPFSHLPFPSPGDRIKADDFKALSQSLNILYNMTVVSASLFGYTFAEAKAVLASQRYAIQRVMTVFGTEITNPGDTSLDSRKVIQVIPAAPGDQRVMVVVTEAVDTRRFAPNLIGLTYRDAASKIQTLLADVTISGAPPPAPQLTGLTLATAEQNFFK